jgi:tetratricopeptide (TPR) repeat protein
MRSLFVTLLLGLLVFSVHAQTGNRRPTRPKPAQTPQKKLDEQAEWDKTTALADAAPRIAALKKFIQNFPKSARRAEASTLLVTAEFASGNDKLVAGEIDGAADLYTAAATDAPKPVPEQLWTDTLSRIAPNLYFRGARGEALDITKVLEGKAESSVGQLLNIATFYLNIENGGEAKRVAEAATKLDANSSAAYQILGLANRMDFQLEDSAAAFAKALDLDPESLTARRGLAEMKRSLGKSDEAVALYREILAKDETNVPARTGLLLSLFDAGDRSDAEAEMTKSLETNSGNVILLAGAAYWYAAHNEGDKAVDYAQKALAADPRFIWSHVALARGLLAQNKPAEAEKTLLAARRYGNFPTLEYEIASARLSAGLYREAAEELAHSFSVKDGMIQARLGGRVARESKYFTELVGYERRASIFAPTAADNPENAAQLRALLELKQELDAVTPNVDMVTQAADDFVRGDDKMKVHRQVFAATQLLDKKTALPKVLEIVKAAPQSLDAGLDVPDASTAVLASELYESRKIAAAREDYVTVPAVPRATLSSVLRGRIEDITGWAYYQMDDPMQAAVHLRRAVGVLPSDSSYWRSSLWRLGTALMVSGKDVEALDSYIKSYNGTPPDAVRYNAIEAVYKRVNGTTDGLEAKIGPNPAPPVSTELVAQKTEPSPTPEIPAAVPATATPSPVPEQKPELTPGPLKEQPKPGVPADVPVATPSPTVEATTPSPTPTSEEPKPSPSPTIEASPAPTPMPVASPTAAIVKDETKLIDVPNVVPIATPTPAIEEPKAIPSPTPEEIKPAPTPDPSPTVTPEPPVAPTPMPEPQKTPLDQVVAQSKPESQAKELFPPVVIIIPETAKSSPKAKPTPGAAPDEPKATPSPTPEQKTDERPSDARPRFAENKPETAEIRPCSLTVSEERVTLRTGGGDLAVVVGRSDDNELDALTATSTSPENVSVRRQVIEGMRTRALFVLHPGTKPGVYQVVFEMPCGKREIVVRVK